IEDACAHGGKPTCRQLVLVLATTTSTMNSTAITVSATPIQPSTMPAVARPPPPSPGRSAISRLAERPNTIARIDSTTGKIRNPPIPSTREAIALPLVSPAATWTPPDMRAPPTLAPQFEQNPASGATGSPQLVQ